MEDALQYESELEEVLLNQSRKQYGIEEPARLIRYLMRRCWILELKQTKLPRIPKEEAATTFMIFWLKDLGIEIQKQVFIYKKTVIPTFTSYGTPLRNIYEDCLHQLSVDRLLSCYQPHLIDEWEAAKEDVAEWLKEAKRKGTKYAKKKEIYPYILKQILLSTLNQTYQAHSQNPSWIEHFSYPKGFFSLSQELICERYVLAFHENVTDGELLAESELEQYMKEHLEELEPGLQLVQTQYVLPNGRIDVLARDIQGDYVVIELKVEKDTDCVWQKWYYCQEIQKRYHTNQVRFILVLPQFYPEIIEPLLQDDIPTKVFKFHPLIQRGTLKQADFTPYTIQQ